MKAEELHVSLVTAITMLHDLKYNNVMIAKKIGVTSLQVHYYHSEKTKLPNPKVCMKFYTEFEVYGKRILLNLYKNKVELEQHLERYNEHKNN